jgi:hypothetical protein
MTEAANRAASVLTKQKPPGVARVVFRVLQTDFLFAAAEAP